MMATICLLTRIQKIKGELFNKNQIKEYFLIALWMAMKILEDDVISLNVFANLFQVDIETIVFYERIIFKQCDFNATIDRTLFRNGYKVLFP
jgi:hypothetical protein